MERASRPKRNPSSGRWFRLRDGIAFGLGLVFAALLAGLGFFIDTLVNLGGPALAWTLLLFVLILSAALRLGRALMTHWGWYERKD